MTGEAIHATVRDACDAYTCSLHVRAQMGVIPKTRHTRHDMASDLHKRPICANGRTTR